MKKYTKSMWAPIKKWSSGDIIFISKKYENFAAATKVTKIIMVQFNRFFWLKIYFIVSSRKSFNKTSYISCS